nr:MAG TPA: hypothetical protein [Caudoviricetes sp.]
MKSVSRLEIGRKIFSLSKDLLEYVELHLLKKPLL